jgi:subtilisin family serine protease
MRLTRGRKWMVLFGCAALLLVLSGASHLAQAQSPDHYTFKPPKSLEQAYVPGEVLVKFKNTPATFRGKPSRKHLNTLHGAAAAEFVSALPTKAQAALERVQGQVVRAHPSIGVLHMKLPSQISTAQSIESLYRSGAVEYAEPNVVIKPQSTPNDSQYSSQWSLPVIKAPEAWDIVYPFNPDLVPPYWKRTIVAVIDTGVKYNHEDFYINGFPAGYTFPNPPDVINNLWVNTLFPEGYAPQGFNDGKDDDNDGFINDYFGINTSGTPATPANEVMDTSGHGTAMAGIIGAFGNNHIGVAGINWQTQIMALKCMTGSSGDAAAAITCINYALAQAQKAGAHLVLTLGWSQSSNTYSSSLRDALRVAQTSGALVVVAAGNNDEDNDIFPNYPSCYAHEVADYPGSPVNPDAVILDNVITVGASDESDKKQTISSYGMATVDLFAPGSNIWSTKISGTPPYGNVGSGTSFAAAHVAGACALLWNQYPGEDWTQIKARIMNGVEDGLPQDFRAICATEGRLNLANSLEPPEPLLPPYSNTYNIPAAFSIFDISQAYATDPPIVPGRADTGQTIVITGVNFGASGTLSFLGTTFPAANIVRWNTATHPNQIIATVPADLPKGVGRLKVTNDAGLTSRGCCFSNITRERQMGSLILGHALAASAQVGNDVWIIGGYSYWGITPFLERYSLDRYHTVVDSDWMMPIPVSNAGAAAIGSKIYVVGGSTEDPATTYNIPVANLQIFDTATQIWVTGPPLPQPLMQCAVTSLGGKLYAIGGLKTTGATTYGAVTDAYVFDPGANAWGALTPLPTATAYAAIAPTAAGKIWVMGGFSSSSTTSQQRLVQEYDPGKNQWTQQRHLVRPRAGAAGINYGGQVYCLHGTKPYSSTYLDEYADGEWYNLAQGYWMPSIMNYLGIFVSPPKVPDRKGLYTPSTGKYLDRIFILGGASGTDSTYKYSYSNKVWAFPAPGAGTAHADITPILNLLLSPE